MTHKPLSKLIAMKSINKPDPELAAKFVLKLLEPRIRKNMQAQQKTINKVKSIK